MNKSLKIEVAQEWSGALRSENGIEEVKKKKKKKKERDEEDDQAEEDGLNGDETPSAILFIHFSFALKLRLSFSIFFISLPHSQTDEIFYQLLARKAPLSTKSGP
ncbi:hypothetical protein TorRG33x02_315470 [Trema orientale]|uniref:Uncharacterized protein n=1 Tax=Trema orientale TaxID=63057 RepID=A0A2P5BN43_TREOI|nr:hypothetical protein TorRG33x02_315470 [Trema orientale]